MNDHPIGPTESVSTSLEAQGRVDASSAVLTSVIELLRLGNVGPDLTKSLTDSMAASYRELRVHLETRQTNLAPSGLPVDHPRSAVEEIREIIEGLQVQQKTIFEEFEGRISRLEAMVVEGPGKEVAPG